MFAKFIRILLPGLLLILPLYSEAAAKKTKCPGAIVDTGKKYYQKLGKSASCYSSARLAENDGLMKGSDLCVTGAFKTVSRIDMSGEGPAYTMTFKAGTSHPKFISSYTGVNENSFSFALIQRSNGHRWVHYVGHSDFSNEETYLNETTPGEEYYLLILPQAKIDKDTKTKSYGSWNITLLTDPNDF